MRDDHFTTVEPQNTETVGLNLFRKRQSTNFGALGPVHMERKKVPETIEFVAQKWVLSRLWNKFQDLGHLLTPYVRPD